MHDDIKQYYLDYGQTDNITSSTDYQHPNKHLNFEEENKNSKSQISTVPELRNSKSMSLPHLDPSALTQVTPPSNIKIASAADTGALNSSALPSFFETNLPSIKTFVSTES